MNEFVLSFNSNGTDFIVIKKDNDFFAGKYENDNISFKLNNSEKLLVNKIFEKMIATQDRIFLGLVTFNNKRYKHFYDKVNSWSTFLNIDNSEINKDELILFNKLYNNRDVLVYYNRGNDNNYIKRIFKDGKRIILVFMSASMILSSGCFIRNTQVLEEEQDEIVINTNIQTDENQGIEVLSFDEELEEEYQEINSVEELEQKTEIEENDTIQYDDNQSPEVNNNEEEKSSQETNQTIELDKNKEEQNQLSNIPDFTKSYSNEEKIEFLMNALKDNTNLTDEEKEFFIYNFDIVKDNIEYIDFQNLYKHNANLKIVYDENTNYEGAFNSPTSTMTFYGAKNFGEVDNAAKTHEKSHTEESDNRDFDLGIGVLEPLDSIFNKEYYGIKYMPNDYSSYDTGYEASQKYIYALMEIIGPEPFRRFHFNQDIRELSNELYKIVPSENHYYALFQNLSFMSNNPSLFNRMKNSKAEGIEETIRFIIDYYYLSKYGEDITNNVEIMIHLDPKAIIDKYDFNDGNEDIYNRTLKVKDQKAYFNKNNPYYMKDSSVYYVKEVPVDKDIMSIEDALKNGLIREENGVYVSNNERCFIREDGYVEIELYNATQYKETPFSQEELNNYLINNLYNQK